LALSFKRAAGEGTKVFWFFFSKKNAFLTLTVSIDAARTLFIPSQAKKYPA
jgi:hypothetical protein